MKSKTILFQLLLACIAAGFAASAAATTYKWTDKDGGVHYSENPPIEGDAVEIAPPPPVATPTADSATGEGAKDNQAAPLSPEQAALYVKNCQSAQSDLEVYRNASTIKQPDGKVVELNEEARQKKIQETQELIKKFCK